MSAEVVAEREAVERIRQAISAGEAAELAERVYDLDTLLIMSGQFSATLFAELLHLIEQQDFLRMEGSWHLLRLFENSWDYLSEEQRDELLTRMEASYGEFADWMSCFVISEILGRQYADERALQSLSRLKKLKAAVPRSMVAHGLEHLVKEGRDQNFARRAFVELTGMRNDPSEQVREEVNASLARLAHAGWK